MLSFIIPPGHAWNHFSSSSKLGSMFFAQSPAEILTTAATTYPHIFKEAKLDPIDGRKRLSFVFDHEIGLCNVVALTDLTPEERDSIIEEERDGIVVRIVHTTRTFPTRECQIILSSDNVVITMFPGPMAPPLPRKGNHSDFWEGHVFIKASSS